MELKIREKAPRRLDAAYKETLNLEMWKHNIKGCIATREDYTDFNRPCNRDRRNREIKKGEAAPATKPESADEVLKHRIVACRSLAGSLQQTPHVRGATLWPDGSLVWCRTTDVGGPHQDLQVVRRRIAPVCRVMVGPGF